MAIKINAKGQAQVTTSSGSLSLAHTVAGSETYLIVSTTLISVANGFETCTGVTYGGVAMTLLGTNRLQIWGLKNPAAGSNNVVASFAAAGRNITMGVTSFTGVDQTNNLPTFGSTFDTTGTSTSPAAPVGFPFNTQGCYVVTVLGVDLRSGTTTATLPSAISLWNRVGLGASPIGLNAGAAGSGSTTKIGASWTLAASRPWGVSCLVLYPSTTTPVNRYWIGNGGYLSDPAHWAETSGGIGGAGAPSIVDTGYYDLNSISSPSQTITAFASSSAACGGIICSGVLNTPAFSFPSNTSFYGSVDFTGATASKGLSALVFFSQPAGTYNFNPANLVFTYALPGAVTFSLPTNLSRTVGLSFPDNVTILPNGFGITDTGGVTLDNVNIGATVINTGNFTVNSGKTATGTAGNNVVATGTVTLDTAALFGVNLKSTQNVDVTGSTITNSVADVSTGATYIVHSGTDGGGNTGWQFVVPTPPVTTVETGARFIPDVSFFYNGKDPFPF